MPGRIVGLTIPTTPRQLVKDMGIARYLPFKGMDRPMCGPLEFYVSAPFREVTICAR
jgi:hypothetical protein